MPAGDGSGQKYLRFCNGADLIIDRNWADLNNVRSGDVLIIFDNAQFKVSNSVDTLRYTNGSIQFFFTNNGRPNLTKAVKLGFTAPSTGPRAGILFFGSRSNTAPALISVLSWSIYDPNMRGAIYMPAAHVQFSASGTLGGCTQIIGSTLELVGSWTGNGPCTTGGARPIVGSRTVKLLQ
jgi:hypothetical protein